MPISRFWGYFNHMIEAGETEEQKKRRNLERLDWSKEVERIKNGSRR